MAGILALSYSKKRKKPQRTPKYIFALEEIHVSTGITNPGLYQQASQKKILCAIIDTDGFVVLFI